MMKWKLLLLVSDYIQKIGTTLDSSTSSRQAMPIIASICNLDVGGQNTAYTASVASNSHIEHVGSGDWREETYQKIKSMKELYLMRVEGLYQKFDKKLQQINYLLSASLESEEQKKLIFLKSHFEDIIQFLKIPKNNIGSGLVKNFPLVEKNILAFLGISQLQEQSHAFGAHLVHPPYTSQISLQPHQRQLPNYADQMQQGYMQPHANQVQQWNMQSHANQVQQSNMQGSATQMRLPGILILQYDSLPSLTHDVSTQRGIAKLLQPSSSMSIKQQEASAPVQKGRVMYKRNGINIPEHTCMQDSEDMLSTDSCQIQPNPNILQKQHEQKMPQLVQQHLMKHLWSTQQSLHLNVHRQMQHNKTQSLIHQIKQLCHMIKANESKVGQHYVTKSGFHQQSFSASKRQKLSGQLLNNCTPVSTYSPEKLSELSPQISHPHKPQRTFLSTPQGCEPSTYLPSSSPFSSIPRSILSDQSATAGDFEDHHPANPILSNSNNIVNLQITPPTKAESVAIATARKEFISPKCNRTTVPTMLKTGHGEKPINCLIRAVQSSTMKTLSCSLSDIASVVSTSNMTAEFALNHGFAADISEILAGMTDSVPEARKLMSHDGVAEADKMNRNISALPLSNVVSAGNINEHANDTSKLGSAATSHLRRHNTEVSHILLKEIQEINQHLITTIVSICDEDVNLINAVSEAPEGIVIKLSKDAACSPDLKPKEANLINVVSVVGKGTVIKCSFSNVALSPDMKSLFTSAQMAPLLPLRLFIPVNYPKCSPIILDLIEPSNELEDLSTKARSRFMTALRGLSQPMSLREMTNLWDSSACTVIREYTMRIGGGTFSSRYGIMQNCEHA